MLNPTQQQNLNDVSRKVIGASIEVHKEIGPGLLESAYEECLSFELETQGLSIKRQVPLPITYKGKVLSCGYRMDILVENEIILELKTVKKIEELHKAQLLSYLRMSGRHLGLILNFHSAYMKQGIKRIVNKF
ncbi:MAG: GxxExxY protein [Acidobacteria bacterium]|nr:MAG: GxxExxY protein [Acidobacteriota bacterium]REJ99327.1 MAG: GxxExxY protein [Acidobacteriota bacterium]REK15651.1 MAG: GxxExxY protein [Acidobacteriota bacterium]REK43634.1 MAG: GxxExxY protein [Acidobacteriota bacterium]